MHASKLLLTLCLFGISYAQLIGPGGFDCQPDQGDEAEVCTAIAVPWDTVTKSGKVECENNFDCCLCESITCNNCEEFIANGDSSAFSVQSITINGKSDGATIDCGGDSSCERANFVASNVKDVKCGGDLSCKRSSFDVAFVSDDGGKLECNGDEACFKSTITATNVLELKCGGDLSCFESSIDIDCTGADDPCKVECDGDGSCGNSTITATNVDSLSCKGTRACQDASILIIDPDDDFKLECGDNGCQDMALTIQINNGLTSLEEIGCGSPNACQGATITITSSGAPVDIETLDCDGFRACDSATFVLTGVTVSECKCSEEYGCYKTVGVPQCEDESTTLAGPGGFDCVWYEDNTDSGDFLCDVGGSTTMISDSQIECDDPSSCCLCSKIICPNCDEFKATDDFAARGVQNITIIGSSSSPASIDCDGFKACADTKLTGSNVKEVKCSGLEVCAAVDWNLACDLNDNCAIECDEESACEASTIAVSAGAKELKCNGYRSCYGGTFSLACTNDESCEIQCEGEEACVDATITADYVKELSCKDDMACSNANIIVQAVTDEEFGLECSEGGCVNAQITINTTTDLKEIKCEGCAGATFNIINSGTASISIDTVDCEGENSCDGATFTFSGSPITIDECKCGEVGDEDFGCTGTVGLTTTVCRDGGIPVSAAYTAPTETVQNEDEEKKSDDDDLYTYAYEINLSPNALANLWGMAALCMLVNIIALFCCFRTKKSVNFEPNDAKERYISDQ